MRNSQIWIISSALSLCAISHVLSVPVHIHQHPEVSIVDYNGPLHHEIFQIIRGVEILEIINSNITRMDGGMVKNLPKLKKIVFINCTIDVDSVDIENLFEGAVNLKEFIARHILAKELRPEIIRKLPIDVFIMTDNRYPKVPSNLFNETKLRVLDLARNNIETIEDGAFNGLGHLNRLILQTNELKIFPENSLKPLKNIRNIDLRENLLTKFSAKSLNGLTTLEELDLSSNPLQEVDLDAIETIAPKLKKIDLSGSYLSEEQKNELKSKYSKILKI